MLIARSSTYCTSPAYIPAPLLSTPKGVTAIFHFCTALEKALQPSPPSLNGLTSVLIVETPLSSESYGMSSTLLTFSKLLAWLRLPRFAALQIRVSSMVLYAFSFRPLTSQYNIFLHSIWFSPLHFPSQDPVTNIIQAAPTTSTTCSIRPQIFSICQFKMIEFFHECLRSPPYDEKDDVDHRLLFV